MTDAHKADPTASDINDLIDDFDFLDDWEDRYRYVIELGKTMPPLEGSEKNDETKVRGCVSQVWLVSERDADVPDRLRFRGESDAHIVQGLIAILLKVFDRKTADEILATDAPEVFAKLGLNDHLTPQRSNGLAAMVQRIRADAERALT